MHLDLNLGKPKNGYRHTRLDRRFKALIEKKIGSYRSRDATLEELTEWDNKLRSSISGLASSDILRSLRHHNPTIFQVIEETESGRVVGFNAQLPLTEEGIDALKSGVFSSTRPSPIHVARSDQLVEAIYVWLTYSPRSFVPAVAGLSDYLTRYAPKGCALFCTPIDDKVESFLRRCGYKPAIKTFPEASNRLLVAHRIRSNGHEAREPKSEATKRIEIVPARTLHNISQVIAIRAATYMHEQECPFDEEFDGNDFCSTHLIGYVDGEPAGCIRIRYFADFVKFERLAVRHEFRASRLAFRLVRDAMKFVARKGYKRVYGHARHDLVRFWQTFGFQPIAGRPPFSFSDVEYVEMEGPIELEVERIGVGDDPLRLIRPEGLWDQPGNLERIQDNSRRNRIDNRLDSAKQAKKLRRRASWSSTSLKPAPLRSGTEL